MSRAAEQRETMITSKLTLISVLVLAGLVSCLGEGRHARQGSVEIQGSGAAPVVSRYIQKVRRSGRADQVAHLSRINPRARGGIPVGRWRRKSIETLLFDNEGLRVGYISAAIDGDEFDVVLDRLQAEAYVDPQARALTRFYEAELKRNLGRSEIGVQLDRIACGWRVCAVTFSGMRVSESSLTSRLLGAAPDQQHGIYSAIVGSLPAQVAGGVTRYRIIFGTSAQNNSITVP